VSNSNEPLALERGTAYVFEEPLRSIAVTAESGKTFAIVPKERGTVRVEMSVRWETCDRRQERGAAIADAFDAGREDACAKIRDGVRREAAHGLSYEAASAIETILDEIIARPP